jgi:hypothetical protein
MVKRSAQTFAIALLFAATIAPVVHAFSHGSKSVSGAPVVVAVFGSDPEPSSPDVVHSILALLGLA